MRRKFDMTREELKLEWQYRYDERIAILSGDKQPTPAQHQQALKEADEAIEKLKHETKASP